MKRFLKLMGVVVALTVVLAPSLWSADKSASESQAAELLRNAYLAVVDAELARSEQHHADAATAYRKALEFYGRLQAEYPGWQGAMVNYRVAECQNALASLESGNGGGESKSVVAAANGTNTEMRLQFLLLELQDVRHLLAAETNAVSGVINEEATREIDRLREQLNNESKANYTLIRKISRLEAKLNRAGITEGTNTQSKAVALAVKTESNRLLNDNKAPDAIALLKEASDMMPLETDLTLQLALAYCRVGRFKEAVHVLQPFDVKHPVNADAMMCLGAAYMGMGEVGMARDATEKALKLKPESAEAYYNMAQILMSITPPDVDAVQAHYRHALELGLAPDAEFENALRTALVISKIRKHVTPPKKTVGESFQKALSIPAR